MKEGIALVTSTKNHQILTLKINPVSTEDITVLSQANDLITEINVGDWVYINYIKKRPVVISKAYYNS